VRSVASEISARFRPAHAAVSHSSAPDLRVRVSEARRANVRPGSSCAGGWSLVPRRERHFGVQEPPGTLSLSDWPESSRK